MGMAGIPWNLQECVQGLQEYRWDGIAAGNPLGVQPYGLQKDHY